MKKPNPFSIFESELRPRMIIEASAGTGKTYNITGTCIRLLLEKSLSIDQILVVTFTRMATKELKDRILERMRECLRAIENDNAKGDLFLEELLSFCRNVKNPKERVRLAIRNFDDAKIFTIHGFCQQVLSEESLISGVPFDIEVVGTDSFLEEAAEDYWRNFVYQCSSSEAGRYYISRVMDYGTDPNSLLTTLMPAIQNREAVFEAVTDDNTPEPLEKFQQLIDLRREMAQLWEGEKEQILQQIRESDVKNVNTHLEGRSDKMEAFLGDNSFLENSFDQLTYFTSTYFSENLKKNKEKLPEHRFFDLCDRYSGDVAAVPQIMTSFLKEAVHDICRLRDEKASDSTQMTYEDLLKQTERALSEPTSGPDLSRRLRVKYPYALVDEFQDTDPLQYRIFEKIYPKNSFDSTLMMIGDPKQAIYAFRGADLYAYLRARADVADQSSYTLLRNFRSTPGLVKAVNAVFTPEHGTPFLDEQVSYHEIEAAKNHAESDYLSAERPLVPLKFYYQNESSSKQRIKFAIFKEVASQIKDLVKSGIDGETRLKDVESGEGRFRNLTPGDIAVLVHSHTEAEIIKNELKFFGITSVTYSKEKVFKSREAERVEKLLAAVVNPAGLSDVHAALTTGFFGNKLSDIYKYQSDEALFFELIERLQTLHDLWYKGGCILMMRKLLFEQEGLINLASLHDSERIVTNLQQLIELAACAEQDQGLDPPALLRWFRKKMAETSMDDEEALRLESDENLVRIITIHNSKGLEFPVVFCPTLWSAPRDKRNTIEVYHRAEEPYNLVVNLDQSGNERRRRAELKARFEEVSEEVRKAYVALTRAKYECRVFWGNSSTGNLSGLGALLYGKENVLEFISDNIRVGTKNGLNENELPGRLEQLAQQYQDTISFTLIPDLQPENGKLKQEFDAVDLSPRKYEGSQLLKTRRSLYSFSSLVHHHEDAAAEPDHDHYVQGLVELSQPLYPDRVQIDIHHFPRGKTAGTFIHKLFEHEKFDFRKPDQYQYIIEELISDYNIDPKWTSVLMQMMTDVSGADYNDMALNQAAPGDTLKEMEFYFPVKEPDIYSIQSALLGVGLENKQSNGIAGYLNGFIDLVVRQKDRYYILDYKSNHLGDNKDQYHTGALAEEIKKAGYDIQYHFYTIALKKYLEHRDPDFNYDLHFGGVYYLFIRGMEAGSSSGIYYDKPSADVIMRLESVLKRNV